MRYGHSLSAQRPLALLMLLLLAVGNAYSQGLHDWEITLVDGSRCSWPSLVLNATGRAHISYLVNCNYNCELRYAYESGTGWQVETVDHSGISAGFDTSLALDAIGQPHIAYVAADELRYAYRDDQTWQRQVVDRAYNLSTPSLAIDALGHPHILYRYWNESYNHSVIKYAYYDGSTWQIEAVLPAQALGSPSLVLDASGRPHISCFDYENHEIKYIYNDGVAWQTAAVTSEKNAGWDTRLALDAASHPHILYSDEASQTLKYTYYDGASWRIETVTEGERVAGQLSLAVDTGGHPHVSYLDYTDADLEHANLEYAHYDNVAWRSEIVGSSGMYTSLALDIADEPRIVYCDGTNGGLMYARQTLAMPLPATGVGGPLLEVLGGGLMLIGMGLVLRRLSK